jgi:hypothetical protein
MTTQITRLIITSIAPLAPTTAVAAQTMATDTTAHMMYDLLFYLLDLMLDISDHGKVGMFGLESVRINKMILAADLTPSSHTAHL